MSIITKENLHVYRCKHIYGNKKMMVECVYIYIYGTGNMKKMDKHAYTGIYIIRNMIKDKHTYICIAS